MNTGEITRAIFGDREQTSCLFCYAVPNPNWLVDLEIFLQANNVNLEAFVAANNTRFELKGTRLVVKGKFPFECLNATWVIEAVEEAINTRKP